MNGPDQALMDGNELKDSKHGNEANIEKPTEVIVVLKSEDTMVG